MAFRVHSRETADNMIDLSIPGQMTEGELRGIEALAKSAPEKACIVETGSLFGLSSFTWATSAPEGSTVYCIDPWVREPWIIELVEKAIPGCPPFGRDAFEKFTAGCKNIIPLQGYSPGDFRNWNTPVDIFFDDAIHENPYLRRNLRFWLTFMKPGGIMCGHDYSAEWPDVVTEVDKLAHELGVKVQTCERLWWIEIPRELSLFGRWRRSTQIQKRRFVSRISRLKSKLVRARQVGLKGTISYAFAKLLPFISERQHRGRIFSEIYDKKAWGGQNIGEFYSGDGSRGVGAESLCRAYV